VYEVPDHKLFLVYQAASVWPVTTAAIKRMQVFILKNIYNKNIDSQLFEKSS
jgi:hypothetical protein